MCVWNMQRARALLCCETLRMMFASADLDLNLDKIPETLRVRLAGNGGHVPTMLSCLMWAFSSGFGVGGDE